MLANKQFLAFWQMHAFLQVMFGFVRGINYLNQKHHNKIQKYRYIFQFRHPPSKYLVCQANVEENFRHAQFYFKKILLIELCQRREIVSWNCDSDLFKLFSKSIQPIVTMIEFNELSQTLNLSFFIGTSHQQKIFQYSLP